jgi:REP element-mobilizing transposase RayT
LTGHDYSSDGKYFNTICTHFGVSLFGNISCGKMFLSESGQIANKIWYELPKHFSFVSLDEFVVMPNHIHGIVIIEPTTVVRTLHATSPQHPTNPRYYDHLIRSDQELDRIRKYIIDNPVKCDNQ